MFRATPRLACPRCRGRSTREAAEGTRLTGAIVAYDARCDGCGNVWKNLDARA